MTIAVLDGGDALQALAPAWDALWRRAGAPPFLSPAWLLPWWDAFGTARPLIATARAGGMLTGMLAMYLLDEGAERKLLPVGIGISDYLDALIDPAAPRATAAALLRAVLDRAGRDGATSCTLAELPPDAALHATPAPPGWRDRELSPTPCPVLRIGDPIPPGQRRNLRQSRHRADRTGGWEAGVATPSDAPGLWQRLVAMHEARWTALGEPGGVLADPAVRAFHDAAVPRLAAAGLLQLQVLRIGGQIAGLYHTLAAPGRLLFYLSGFDAAHAPASPGTLLLGAIIERAAEQGVGELHFLRGGEPYKYAWGATDRLNRNRLLLPA